MPERTRKPTRIELPGEGVRQSCMAKDVFAKDGEISESPAYKRNPNLYIRRPGVDGANDENARRNALVDKVEARSKAEARRKLMTRLKKSVFNIIAIAVLAGLAVVGFKFYKTWKNDWDVKPMADVVNQKKAVPVDYGKVANGDKVVSRAAVPKSEPRSEKADDANRQADENFEAVKNRFVGCKVSYWGKLPKNERPGSVDGLFHLSVPTRDGAGEYYEIHSTATNALVMNRVTGRAELRKPLGNDDFARLLTERGGFVLKDDVAYLVTPTGAKKSYQAPTRKGESFSPAEAVFGAAYREAQKMTATDLRFEVSFRLAEKDEARKIADVRFGESVPYEAFEKVASSLAKEIRRKTGTTSPKVRAFKRTVVFYDGSRIARGMNGVTKVPRKRPNAYGSDYSEWVRLRDVALRQESEEQSYAAEAKRAWKERNEKMNGPATESEIRKVLLAGAVIVKRM